MSVIYRTSVNERTGRDPKMLDEYIAGTARGDRDSFEKLYRATCSSVYAYALSVLKSSQDAEDTLHDCYVNIFSSASSYISSGKPMAWILTIARNLCFRTIQTRSHTTDIPEEDWDRFLQQNDTLSEDDRLTIRTCMLQLGGEERRILMLHAVASRAVKKMKIVLEKESLS